MSDYQLSDTFVKCIICLGSHARINQINQNDNMYTYIYILPKQVVDCMGSGEAIG